MARSESDETAGLGGLVFLQLTATSGDPGPAPKVEVPPLKKPKLRRQRGPRVSIRGRAKLSRDGISVRLRCPRGNGAAGCRGTLTVQYRAERHGTLRDAGSTPFALASGAARVVTVADNGVLVQALSSRPRLRLRLTAATRAEDGSVRLTRAKRFIAE